MLAGGLKVLRCNPDTDWCPFICEVDIDDKGKLITVKQILSERQNTNGTKTETMIIQEKSIE